MSYVRERFCKNFKVNKFCGVFVWLIENHKSALSEEMDNIDHCALIRVHGLELIQYLIYSSDEEGAQLSSF